ncbi:hypothetical protein NMD70_06120 [Edwardsiella tarda]|uniref:hypothetical protein n=1 Tax=Edwardsiella tarda TaxID=636 RepID=UPI00351C4A20
MTNIFKWKLMVDQGNYRGWTGVGAIALAMGLSVTAAWGAAPSSASSGERSQTKSLVINENGGIPLRNYNTAQRAALLFTPLTEIERFTINMVIVKTLGEHNYTPISDLYEITTSFTYDLTYL